MQIDHHSVESSLTSPDSHKNDFKAQKRPTFLKNSFDSFCFVGRRNGVLAAKVAKTSKNMEM